MQSHYGTGALVALLVGSSLAGCVSVKLPPPTASADTVVQLRRESLGPAKDGTFALAADKPAAMDKSVGGLRGSSLGAEGGSFSGYLRDELVNELKAAGLYDPNATTSIDGYLTNSQLDAAISKGTGLVSARFVVKKNGTPVFDKELTADDSWDSSFIGAIAIPEAVNHYSALYKKLVRSLFDDPDFRAVVRK